MPTGVDTRRVCLADDHPLFREGLAALLRTAGVDVVGTYGSADELMTRLAEDRPDTVIVDIQMLPTFTNEGIEAARQIREQFPEVGILILSMYVEAPYASAVMSIGTTSIGYLLKDRVTDVDTLIDALQRISLGDCVVDPQIVNALLQRPTRQSAIAGLTDRERDVLQLMAEGHSNSRIAHELHLAVRTIEANIASIMAKFGLSHENPDTHRRVHAVITWLRGT